MNRHRSNWSAMHDADTEQSQQSKELQAIRERIAELEGE